MVVNKVIKTPLGYLELGMQCGKIVWCGFAPDSPGSSGALGAAQAQKCHLVCPSGAEWAQKDTQMCPEEGESASWEQKCRLVCPEQEGRMPEYSLDDLLRGRGSIFQWDDLQLQGTPLQMRVWRELFNLLPDELVTYSELASRCGYPRAVRAVATAVGKNPVSLIIPCHRVVRKAGNPAEMRKSGSPRVERKAGSGRRAASVEAWELGNYRWGSELKKRILEWEGII